MADTLILTAAGAPVVYSQIQRAILHQNNHVPPASQIVWLKDRGQYHLGTAELDETGKVVTCRKLTKTALRAVLSAHATWRTRGRWGGAWQVHGPGFCPVTVANIAMLATPNDLPEILIVEIPTKSNRQTGGVYHG